MTAPLKLMNHNKNFGVKLHFSTRQNLLTTNNAIYRDSLILIYMIISNCARVLHMPKSAKMYPNVGKYASMSNFVNMSDYTRNLT